MTAYSREPKMSPMPKWTTPEADRLAPLLRKMTAKEAAIHLGLHEKTVRAIIKREGLVCHPARTRRI